MITAMNVLFSLAHNSLQHIYTIFKHSLYVGGQAGVVLIFSSISQQEFK